MDTKTEEQFQILYKILKEAEEKVTPEEWEKFLEMKVDVAKRLENTIGQMWTDWLGGGTGKTLKYMVLKTIMIARFSRDKVTMDIDNPEKFVELVLARSSFDRWLKYQVQTGNMKPAETRPKSTEKHDTKGRKS